MDPLLQDGINKFLDHLDLVESKSAHTISNYRRYLQHFLEFSTNLLISRLTEAIIQEYRLFLSSKHSELSPITQNYHLTALREFIHFANQNSWLEINPRSIKLHSIPKKRVSPLPGVALSTLQGQKIKPCEEGLRDQLILELLVGNGLKVSE